MSHTITIETRISNDVLQKDNLNDALVDMASGFCHAKYSMWSRKIHHHCRFILPEDKLKADGHDALKQIKQLFDAWQKDIFHKIKHHLPIRSIEQDVSF